MIEEESQFPMDTVFIVIMMIALFVVIAFVVGMIIDIQVDIELRTLDRAGVEISDALVKSELTEELAIFKKEELNKYDGTRVEPYIQHCQFGYTLEFKTKNDNLEIRLLARY